MATNPYAWAQDLAARESQRAAQRENDSMNMLMAVFQEEAARQRPFVTMPAELALRQQDRINAEPFAIRAAQRRYKQTEASTTDASGDGIKQLADGSWVEVIDGVPYPTAAPEGE